MAQPSILRALAMLAVAASPTMAFWRLPCKSPVVVERADPIINPGVPSPHLHTIMGGNGFGFTIDYAQTQASKCSSCTVQKDLSNYWIPNLWYHAENGSFTSVEQIGGVTVYYLQRPGDGENLTAFPEGLRMVAGDPMKRSSSNDKDSEAISYACLNYDGPATPETNAFPTTDCPSGLRTQVFFPSCWDGQNLDSPDHRSHMAYPLDDATHGACPSSHPVHFISLFYEVIFNTAEFGDRWYGDQQPFVWSNGDPTGYSLHGDFVNGWEVDHLQRAIDECTSNSGNVEDCPVFSMIPDDVAQGCIIPSSIDEPTSGTLDALPGCNPVQAGPERATVQSEGCTVSNAIGQPQKFFTDVTQTKKWSYTGCGTDNIADRQFTSASTSSDNMTVESCIDFCSGKGHSVAGTEFGRECYCADSIPDAAAPMEGYMGNCMTKCAGDSSQYCGGAGTISLYERCGDSCQNAKDGMVGNSTSTEPASMSDDTTSNFSSSENDGSGESSMGNTSSTSTAGPSSPSSSTEVATDNNDNASSHPYVLHRHRHLARRHRLSLPSKI